VPRAVTAHGDTEGIELNVLLGNNTLANNKLAHKSEIPPSAAK
jgi:hypothetical protein